MKLNKISATGLKGGDFSYDLSEITILVGRNFRGKTRVMDAIRLALLGYLPELGKQNSATFGLASAREMRVVAEFDNGMRVERAWRINGDSVSASKSVPPEFEKLGDLSVMLNAEVYFTLSDRQRVEYVFANCPQSTSKAAADVLGDVGDGLTEQFADEVGALEQFFSGLAVKGEEGAAQYIERVIPYVTDAYKDARATVLRTEKTIEGLIDMQMKDEPQVQVSLLEGKRVEMNEALRTLNEQKGKLAAEVDAAKKTAERRKLLEQQLTKYKEIKRTPDVILPEIEALQAEAKGFEVSANQVTTRTEHLARASAVHLAAKKTVDDLRRSLSDTEKKIADIDGQSTCPYCGASGSGWKSIRAAELAQKSQEITENIAEAEKKMVEARELAEDCAILLEEAKGNAECFQAKTRQITRLKEEFGMANQAATRMEALADELKTLPEPAETNVDQLTALTAEISTKSEQLAKIETQLKVAAGRELEKKRLADAEKDRDEARIRQKIAETAGKTLREIQAELVEETFRPLIERANYFVQGILRGRLAYNAKEGGEIGMRIDGGWVGHRTFSGTEKALTYAAIQAALAMTSPCRLMMIDELGKLDNITLKLFMDRLAEVFSRNDALSGFVGIDPERADTYKALRSSIPQLTVIEV